MLKHKKIICFFSILFLAAGAWAQKNERALTLEDCILKAMKNNLNVTVEVLNPELADISVSRAKENFLPSLSFGYSLQNTNSPSFSFIEAEETISTEYKDYSASIFQRIPTGGEFSISLYSYKNESNMKFLSVNPRYASTLRFNFTIEILSAQTEVASREADILQAEAMVKNNEDLLKTIINLAAEEKGVEADIIPVDKPAFAKKEISLEDALLTALENRPDLQASRIDVQNKEINLSYARNQLLPDLSLQASYWSPGISGTKIVYDPLDPFGAPIMTIPGGSSAALRDAADFKYKNWSVGLTLSIPLNSVLSRAEYAQARVNLDQAMFRLENQEQQIFLEIKNAVRAVQTDYKRVHAYKIARELAEKKLEAEAKKLKVGLTTNYVVVQYQRDLANARSAELQAIIDYNLSLARLDKALGTTLKNKNIRFSDISEDIKRKT